MRGLFAGHNAIKSLTALGEPLLREHSCGRDAGLQTVLALWSTANAVAG